MRDVDLGSEIVVSRMPAKTVLDVKAFVDRILEYESYPKTNNWENNILLCANENTSKGGYPGADNTIDELYNNSIKPYWSGTSFRLFCSNSDNPLKSGYDFNKENLQTELSKGYTFMTMLCHGWTQWFGYIENYELYTNSDADSLKNSGYTVVLPMCCFSNHFNEDVPCMGEAFMNNPNSGVIAYIGHSAFGFGSYSSNYFKSFFKNLFLSQDHQIGQNLNRARNDMLWACNRDNSQKYVCLYTNMLGDPGTPMYLSFPKKFDHVQTTISDNTTRVNIGVDNCRISVVGETDDPEYYEVLDSVSEFTVNNPSKTFYISITKTGYIPYILRTSDSLYVQDQIIDYSMNFKANKIFIGKDVTHSFPYGDVEINSGTTTIDSNNGVVIKNGFSLKKGARLLINSRKK